MAETELSVLPDVPLPPTPEPSLEELLAAGQSVVSELGLFSWWAPPGYFRYALEYMHVHWDLPWWVTIIGATTALRLAFFYVPIVSRRLAAHSAKHAAKMQEFMDKQNDAKLEGDQYAVQKAMGEQQTYMKEQKMNPLRQISVTFVSGAVFATQFMAIKKMTSADFPGFSTGGAFWFQDLTAPDPLFLPALSAVTMWAVFRSGVETGGTAYTMSKRTRLIVELGIPCGIIGVNYFWEFPQAVLLYWCTSNVVSLAYAGLFGIPAVQKALKIPPLPMSAATTSARAPRKGFFERAKSGAQGARTPTMGDLRRKDAEQFRKAGQGKPAIKINQ